MANFDFGPIRAKGIALIKRMGGAHQILRATNGAAPDATKPWRVATGTVAATDFRGPAYDVPMSNYTAKGPSDKNVIIPGDLGFVPDESMRIVLAGNPNVQWSIIATLDYDPDGVPIGWKCRIKAWTS